MLNYMEMERYISAIAMRADLGVRWQDSESTPKTDGKTLYLPRMQDGKNAADAYSHLLHYATHEVDHVLYSDFQAPTKYAKGVDASRSFLGAIWNAVEDARIEYQGANEYEGDRKNSNKVYHTLMGGIKDKLKTAQADVKQTIGALLTFVNQSYADVYSSAGLLAADLERVSKCPEQDKLLSGDYLNVLRNVREIADPAKGTRATYDLAKRIFEEVYGGDAEKEEQRCKEEAEQEAKGQGKKQQSKQENGDGDSQQAQSGASNEGDGEGEAEGSGQGEGSDQEGAGEGQDSNGDGDGQDGEDGEAESDKAKAGSGKQGKARSKFQTVDYTDYMMDAHTKGRPGAGCHLDYSNYQGNGLYSPATKDDYKVKDYTKQCPTGYNYAGDGIKGTLARQSTGFANRIRTVLQIRDRDRFSYGTKQGKLHNPNLHRITMKDATGYNQRVFKKKHVNNVLDAAVTLLVDQSSSMSGPKYAHAAAAAAMLNDTIGNTLHIPVEVISFTNDCNTSRWSSTMYIHRAFTDKRLPNDSLIARMGSSAGDMNSNSDGDAIMFAFDRLIKRPEKRKLLVVFSDGSPAGGNGDIRGYTLRVVKAIENESPVDIVGIGIMDTNVQKIYKENQVISEVSELEKALLNVIEHKLK